VVGWKSVLLFKQSGILTDADFTFIPQGLATALVVQATETSLTCETGRSHSISMTVDSLRVDTLINMIS
jgi:hypothetical protein